MNRTNGEDSLLYIRSKNPLRLTGLPLFICHFSFSVSYCSGKELHCYHGKMLYIVFGKGSEGSCIIIGKPVYYCCLFSFFGLGKNICKWHNVSSSSLFMSNFWLPLLSVRTPPPPPDDFMNDDMDSYLIAMDTSIAPGPSTSGPPTTPLADSTCSKQPAAASHRTRLHSEVEEEDETSDTDKPPNKKVRFSFGRIGSHMIQGWWFFS